MRGNFLFCLAVITMFAGCADDKYSSCEEATFMVSQLPFNRAVIRCVSIYNDPSGETHKLGYRTLAPNAVNSQPTEAKTDAPANQPYVAARQPAAGNEYRLHYVLFQTIRPNEIGIAILDSRRPPNLILLESCTLSEEISPTCRPIIKEEFFPEQSVAPASITDQPPPELQFEEKPAPTAPGR